MKEITLFSPATVANVASGFDVLGLCLDNVGDKMIVRKVENKGVFITKIEGYDLPLEIHKNVAGVSAMALYKHANPDYGFEIEIYKHIKPGSGIGSSSASAAGSVYGMNILLGKPYSKEELVGFALKGEALASGSEHADNIAPAIYGGFTLVKSLKPLRILNIPTPNELYVTLIHPQIEIKTVESRAILPKEISLKNAITQWANVGSLVHGLNTNDYDLIGESLIDLVAEPYRSKLIPHYDLLKERVLKAGALGCGISGSGPSIFTLSKTKATAEKIQKAMNESYKKTDIKFHTFVSKINTEGIKTIFTK